MNNLSAISYLKKELNEAFKYAEKAIKADNGYANAYVNRGMALEMLRDQNGACESWKKAAELGSAQGKQYYSSNCND